MGLTLEAYHLTVGHDRTEVLVNIDLHVSGGEVLGLVGANGCGKTTFIRTVAGLLPPLAGSVLISGEDTRLLSAAGRARLLAYVPQAARPPFPYRVADYVLLGRAPHVNGLARPTDADRAAVRSALAEMGIVDLAGRPVTQLSGGQLQLVLIARALAQEPRVLVLDEPASSLDFGHQTRLLLLLRKLAARGLAILMSTHHPDHVSVACDRVALLAEGRVVAIGTPAAALTGEALSRIYGVSVAVEAITLPSGEVRRVCLPQVSAAGPGSNP